MAKKNDIQIIITAVDKASAVLNKTGLSLQSLGKVAVIGGGAIAAMAAGVGVAAFSLAKAAAPIEGIKNAFEGLTSTMEGGSKKMLASLEESSYGMVKQSDLMTSFNQAAQLVSKDFAERMPDAMKYLSKVSAATGTDMNYMIDSMVKGVGRLSPMILDNLGIQVSLEEATANAAAAFGVQADQLSKAQIQTGMMNVVMEKLKTNTADMPDIAGTAAQSFAALQTKLANLKDEIGLKLLPLFNKIAEQLSIAFDSPEVQTAIDNVLSWIGNVIGDENSGIVGVITTLAEGGISALIKEAFGFEPSDKFTDMLDKLLGLDAGTAEEKASGIKDVYFRYYGKDGEITNIMQGFIDNTSRIQMIGLAIQTGNFEAAGLGIRAILIDWTTKYTEKWQQWLTGLSNKIKEINWKALGSDIITNIGNGILSKFDWVQNNIVIPFQKLFSGLSGNISMPDTNFGGMRAGGGSVTAGKTYMVGERGPEMFTPRASGYITPNNKLGGSGQSLALTVNINSAVNLADRSFAERELMPYIEAGVRQLLARAA